jgi:hypothetical protein
MMKMTRTSMHLPLFVPFGVTSLQIALRRFHNNHTHPMVRLLKDHGAKNHTTWYLEREVTPNPPLVCVPHRTKYEVDATSNSVN